MTRFHNAPVDLIAACICSGVLPTARAPMAVSRAVTSGEWMAPAIVAEIFCTTGTGVPCSTAAAYQLSDSKSG